MIVAERKPLEEVAQMVKPFKKILNVGCGGCTSICLAGGQREVAQMTRDLTSHFGNQGAEIEIHELTIERQCNTNFFSILDSMVENYDALLSMACGAGVQFAADRYTTKPVFPALNTTFVGFDKDVGWFEENCRTCGDCVLGETGGICPVTRCAKSLFNGPCGGTRADGSCEVDKETRCAWYEIHKRLKSHNRLDLILKVRPAREWVNQTRRSLVQEPYKDRYTK